MQTTPLRIRFSPSRRVRFAAAALVALTRSAVGYRGQDLDTAASGAGGAQPLNRLGAILRSLVRPQKIDARRLDRPTPLHEPCVTPPRSSKPRATAASATIPVLMREPERLRRSLRNSQPRNVQKGRPSRGNGASNFYPLGMRSGGKALRGSLQSRPRPCRPRASARSARRTVTIVRRLDVRGSAVEGSRRAPPRRVRGRRRYRSHATNPQTAAHRGARRRRASRGMSHA